MPLYTWNMNLFHQWTDGVQHNQIKKTMASLKGNPAEIWETNASNKD